jgi:hypothetical protein
MTDRFLEKTFKELIYIFGEHNWDIIKDEAWTKFINNDEPFTPEQLKDLKLFTKGLLEFLNDEPEN